MQSKSEQKPDIEKVLGLNQAAGKRKRLGWGIIIVLILMISVLAGTTLWRETGGVNSVQYKSREVRRGDLTLTVTATGTLEPTNLVEVGSELSGIIKSVEVNDNDRVKAGQILARLDTEKLKARVLQSKAALESSQARVLQVQATMAETLIKLDRLKQLYELSHHKVPSLLDIDMAEASLKRAKADEASAKAQVAQARAELEANQTDLSKTIIRSPINGLVLTRNVEPGQTVAASLQAPVLFTLAEDLTMMELHVDVDEADVSLVKEGQEATFTVDAYPGQKFPATITQVRYAAQTVSGVVTYETVLKVNNSDLMLRPGMTATADITVKNLKDVILVPNAALRFEPPTEQDQEPKESKNLITMLLPRRPRRSHASRQPKEKSADKQQQVWTLRQGKPVAIPLSIGLSDGLMTEVVDGDVHPGLSLLVEIVRAGR
jgi:HlyD family secretion protein